MATKRFYKQIFQLAAILCSCNLVFAQQNIADLRYALMNATSAKSKADIYFHISRKYADGLMIDSALYFAEKIKELSNEDNYKEGIGKYHLALSFAYFYRGQTGESKQNARDAIQIFTRLKEYSFLGIAHWQLAMSEGFGGTPEISRKNYWQSVYYLKSANDHDNLYRTYFLLARSYEKTSDYDSAAHYYFHALTLAENSKDSAKIYTVASELGETFLNLRNLPKAYQYLDYGLNHRTASSGKVAVWIKINNYAICLSLMHKFQKADSAIAVFEKSARQFNDEWGWITLNKLKGILEYEKRNYVEAVKYLDAAFQKRGVIPNNKTDIKDIALCLGKAEFKTINYERAIPHLRYAAHLSRQIKLMLDEMEADSLIAESFEKIDMPDSALFYFRNYSLLRDSVLSIERQKMVMEVTTRYESERKEQAIRILQKESEANSYLLRLRNKEIETQALENEKQSQQLELAVKQNEINQLDISQKSLNLDNEKKENEKNQARLKLLEQAAAYQKLLAAKQDQQRNGILVTIAALLLFSAYVVYRYMRRKKLQNQQEVLNERLRISRELHDELGATLTGIAMYSHLTKEQIRATKTQEVEKSLNNIQQSAGDMVNKLSDIVWLVNPQKDSLQDLIERLEQYAEEMTTIKGMEVKISVSPKLVHVNLPVENRRSIYLFCKEAINNAVKYSNAELLEITMRECENKKIEIIINDNGKGFDLSGMKCGNGLINMKQRAADVGGEYSLSTSPGRGTRIALHLKIT